jgi:phosphoribosylformimino-5-aminoimidazole carboxamide ribotide isomerase
MIYPSIDLMDGKAVQLVQGKKENKKLEVEDVFSLAETFSQLGEINVIDLGAVLGLGHHQDLICQLATQFPIRVGGGIRSVNQAKIYIDAGAKKIIIGSAAFSKDGINTAFLIELNRHIKRDQVMIALDSYQNAIVTKGWTETTNLSAPNVIQSLEPFCDEFLYTQVDKEGLMQGTDIQRLLMLKSLTKNQIAAAGGISNIEEIKILQSHGISSILGMALYTGKIPFDALLQYTKQ